LYWLLGELANTQWTPDQLTFSIDPDMPKGQRDQAIANRDLAIANLKASSKIFDELVVDYKVRAADLRERRQILREFAQTVPEAPALLNDFDDKAIDEPGKVIPPAAAMNPRSIAITFAAGFA